MIERKIGIGVVRAAVAAGCAIALGCAAFAAPALGMSEPHLVRDIGSGAADGQVFSLGSFDGRLYFAADDGASGRELWSSDGTEAGTTLFKDINPGLESSFPIGMTDAFGELIFRATDGVNGEEPWASDGTPDGTAMVTDINPSGGSFPDTLTLAETRTYFRASDGTNGYELWAYEGAPGETALVKDLGLLPTSILGPMVSDGDTVYFGGNDSTGLKLWSSDGTEVGTEPVTDDVFVDLSPHVWLDGKLFFSARTAADGLELWVYDSAAGTIAMLETSEPGVTWGLPLFPSAVEVGGTVLFTAEDGSATTLWRTDGTPGGTEQVKDGMGMLGELTVVDGVAYFAGGDGTAGVELWRSDGTEAGTRMVADIDEGLDASMPEELTAIDGRLFFSGNDGDHGYELWMSDGTEEGTEMVVDIKTGAAESSAPNQITQVGNDVFFVAETEDEGRELWSFQLDIPPVATNDSASVAEDAPATAVGVLGNDTDADGGPKSIGSVTQPANGEVVVTGGGSGLTYEPDQDYCNGGSPTDDFTYELSPGGDTATVAMTVSCVEDPPVAVDDAATVSEDAAATEVDVLANDTDVDGGSISVASVTQPANGEVAVTGGGAGLTYRPNGDFCTAGSATDDFTYALSPGGDIATVAMTVTCVDDPPPPSPPGDDGGVVVGGGGSGAATTEGGGVSVSLTCTQDTTCEGTATLTGDVPNAVLATISRVVVLARGSYSIPAGQTREITLQLTPAGRKALRSLGSLQGTIEIVDGKTGARATFQIRVLGDPVGTAAAKRSATVRKGVARLSVRCRGKGACKGRATLAAETRRGKRTTRVTLGAKRFAIPAGKTKTLRVKLNRAGRSRLAKSPSGRLRVKLSGSGVKSRTVTLKAG